jgi:hypothetical protein
MPAIMANNDYPVLDGVAPSWADVKVTASPTGAPLIEMKDIKSVNTGATVEVGTQKAGGRVIKRTVGESSYEASMVLYREGYQKLLRGLKGLAPSRGNTKVISLVHFGVAFQHTPPGSTEIYEVRIKGCRLTGRALNSAEGTDADEVEVTLNPAEVVDVIDGEEVAIL